MGASPAKIRQRRIFFQRRAWSSQSELPSEKPYYAAIRLASSSCTLTSLEIPLISWVTP
jgi:hypothetical protein